MERRIILIIMSLVILFSGCATVNYDKKIADLEDEISTLKKQVRIAMAGQAGGTGAFRWRPALTGTDGLDTISCTLLDEGYAAAVPYISGTDVSIYFYAWDEDTSASALSPTIIVPTDRATNCSGLGAWRLAKVFAPSFIGSVLDGYHFFDASNSSDLVTGERLAGRCWFNKTTNKLNCISSSLQLITIGP